MLKLKTEQRRDPSQQKVRQSDYIKEYDLANNQLHTADLLSPATPQTHQSSFPNLEYIQPPSNSNPFFRASQENNQFSDPSMKQSFNKRQMRQNADIQAIDERKVIQLVLQFPTDSLLTEQLKQRIINLIRMKDKGILGAFMLYQDDRDFEGFKARVIHKVITPNASRETANYPRDHIYVDSTGTPVTSSSTSTAGFQYPGTAFGGPRKRTNPSHDRYMNAILELERKGMIDDHIGSIIKTLILEENIDIYRVINQHLAHVISEKELSFKLNRLAQQLGAYCERPQSPLPKRKQELMTYVNSLARYHFTDPDDVQLLQKLIHDENEFILSTFDVFDSDKDHENLIDSLQRIIDKSKTMGLHLQSVTASSFYNYTSNNPWARQAQSQTLNQQQQRYYDQSNVQPSYNRPSTPNNGVRYSSQGAPTLIQANVVNPRQVQSNQYRNDRHQSVQPASRQKMYVTRDSYVRSGEGYEFKPTTTVHDVALIPNYFSSGEEDHEHFESHQRLASREEPLRINQQQQPLSSFIPNNSQFGVNIYKTPTQNQTSYQRAALNANINANYFYKTPAAHQQQTASTNSIEDYQFSLGVGSMEQQPQIRDQILIRDGDIDQISQEETKLQDLQQQNQPNYQDKSRNFNSNPQRNNWFDNPQYTLQNQERPVVSNQVFQKVPQATQNSQPQIQVQQKQNTQFDKPPRSNSNSVRTAQSVGNTHQIKSTFGPLNQLVVQKRNSTSSKREPQVNKNQKKKADKKAKGKSRRIQSSSDSSSSSSQSDNYSSSETDSEFTSSESSDTRRRRLKKERKMQKQKQKSKKQRKGSSKKDVKKLQEKKQTSDSEVELREIQKITEEENLEGVMRPDTFVFFNRQLSDPSNLEIRKFFKQFKQTEDSMVLLSQIMCSSEDQLLAYFEKNFSNIEIGVLMKLRQQRDATYYAAFMTFSLHKNLQRLTESLKTVIEDREDLLKKGYNSFKSSDKNFQNVPSTHIQTRQSNYLIQQKTRKEILRDIFDMIFTTEYMNKPEYQYLQDAFESETPELFAILESYTSHNDYLKLKLQIESQIKRPQSKQLSKELIGEGLISNSNGDIRQNGNHPQNGPQFKSLNEAINNFIQKEKLQQPEIQLLTDLQTKNDQNLKAVWEVYSILYDSIDMLESLKLLLIVTKRKQHEATAPPQKAKQAQKSESDQSFERDEEDNHFNQSQPKQSNFISLMPTRQRNDSQSGSDDQTYTNANDSPKEPYEDNYSPQEDEENEVRLPHAEGSGEQSEHSAVELTQIQEFQHTILRKYALTGMISYVDTPAFHNLVDNKDYRMICIFEVFSQNRSEDDFLENLALIAQIIKEQEPAGSADENIFTNTINNQVQTVESQAQNSDRGIIEHQAITQDPFLIEVESLGGEGLISEDVERWLRQKYEEKLKKLMTVFGVYKRTKDRLDFIDSIKRLYQKENQTTSPVVQQIQGDQGQVKKAAVVQQPVPQAIRDPFITEIEAISSFQGISREVEEFCKQAYFFKDKMLMKIHKVYLQTLDRDDFINSLKRLHSRSSQK